MAFVRIVISFSRVLEGLPNMEGTDQQGHATVGGLWRFAAGNVRVIHAWQCLRVERDISFEPRC